MNYAGKLVVLSFLGRGWFDQPDVVPAPRARLEPGEIVLVLAQIPSRRANDKNIWVFALSRLGFGFMADPRVSGFDAWNVLED